MYYVLILIVIFASISFKKNKEKRLYEKEIKMKEASLELSKALEREYGEKYKERANKKEIINDQKPYQF